MVEVDDLNPELSPQQIQELMVCLRSLEAELLQQIKENAAAGAPVSLEESIGRLSRMELIQQQQMTKATQIQAERRLGLVRSALSRGDDYGLCLSCEESIAYRRLKVRPETPTCLRCQAAREGSTF